METAVKLGPVSVLTITGNIDGSNFQQLVADVEGVIRQGYKQLVLDFQGVPYLSSAGIVALQTILGQITNQGGRLTLAGVREEVKQTLELVGVIQWLNLYPDVASALTSFGEI